MKLLVRNLAQATTEEKLVSLFSEHGKVQSCSLVLDSKTGKSKGFGFIEMPKPGDAKAALKSLNGLKLAGNIIRVKRAEPKAPEAKVADEKTAPVQFKQTPKVTVAKTNVEIDSAVQEAIDNTDNSAKLYGKVKQSDEF